jgi:ribosomal protein S18 acetylase RimI-like enzyme
VVRAVRVRRLLPGEELAVLHAAYLFDEAPDLSAVRTYLADDRNIFFFAFEGSNAVGFLRGTELRQITSRRRQMFLYEISVDETFRRKGVGSSLVKMLLQDCRDRGFEEVFVFTDPANQAAVALYRSTGAVTETPADRMFVYPLHSGFDPPV